MKQQRFEKIDWRHRYAHGGVLRQKRKGRKARPLSTKTAIHLVLKANQSRIRGGFRTHRRFQLIHFILRKYANYFWVRIDQVSIQADHIHLLIRAPRRSKYLDFFRVIAGQIAQRLEKEGLLSVERRVTGTPSRKVNGLWRCRPFTRVVTGGFRALKTIWNYIQLNEKEALGEIPYRKERLRGLSLADWTVLWS